MRIQSKKRGNLDLGWVGVREEMSRVLGRDELGSAVKNK